MAGFMETVITQLLIVVNIKYELLKLVYLHLINNIVFFELGINFTLVILAQLVLIFLILINRIKFEKIGFLANLIKEIIVLNYRRN